MVFRLVWALEYAGWQVAGRRVVIRVLGHQRPPTIPEHNLDFLGWQPQERAVELLSTSCDVLYCPYPYAASLAEVAKYSFPSKIPTYLAAGRPILFHGPTYASPARYLEATGAGFRSVARLSPTPCMTHCCILSRIPCSMRASRRMRRPHSSQTSPSIICEPASAASWVSREPR